MQLGKKIYLGNLKHHIIKTAYLSGVIECDVKAKVLEDVQGYILTYRVPEARAFTLTALLSLCREGMDEVTHCV